MSVVVALPVPRRGVPGAAYSEVENQLANKTQKYKYGFFTHLTEACSGGKERIKREFVPCLAAWLLLMGSRHEKTARHIEGTLMKGAYPGQQSMLRYARQSVQCVEHLIHALEEKFSRQEWYQAVDAIAEAFGIGLEDDPHPSHPVDTIRLAPYPERERGDQQG